MENYYNVLVKKKQIKPIKIKGIKPEGMDANEWDELDELAESTIMLTLSKNVYLNVNKVQTSYVVWSKLRDLYDKKSVALQVY